MKIRRDIVMYAGLAAVLVAGLVALFFAGPALALAPRRRQPAAGSAQAAEARKIRARLFYVDSDGEHLIAVEQEVPYGEGTTEQAKRIVEAALRDTRCAESLRHSRRHETESALSHQQGRGVR